jgi:hypothetical protein
VTLPFFQHADSCGPGATQVEGQFNETVLQGVGLPNHAASKVIDPLDFARQIARSGAPATNPMNSSGSALISKPISR